MSPKQNAALQDYLLCQAVGGLPFAGGTDEQPHMVRLYFQLFRAADAEAMHEEQKKSEQSAK